MLLRVIGVFVSGGERGIRTLGRLLTYTRFPGVRLKPLIHLSVETEILALLRSARQGGRKKFVPDAHLSCCACTTFIAEAISEDISVMLDGTTSVVRASEASLP